MTYKKPNVSSKHFDSFLAKVPLLTGKTVVITGTTSGTGKVVSRVLASKEANVIMLNRPSERSELVQQELHQLIPNANVMTIECDLQSFTSVQRAADAIQTECASGLYALINNAGIMALPDESTEDGFDIQMQTNYLSHFLLTRELYPLLKKGADAYGDSRIVNHSSMARWGVRKLVAKYLEPNGGNLGGNGANMIFGGARWIRYSQTKLANAAFTAALHHKLQAKDSKVRALVAHPGWANTELQVTTSKSGGLASWNSIFAQFISQSPEDGALGILSCTVLPEAESGQFYGPTLISKGKSKPFALEKHYDNAETRELLWSKSCAAIGKEFNI